MDGWMGISETNVEMPVLNALIAYLLSSDVSTHACSIFPFF
jgi:hypothetical protein